MLIPVDLEFAYLDIVIKTIRIYIAKGNSDKFLDSGSKRGRNHVSTQVLMHGRRLCHTCIHIQTYIYIHTYVYTHIHTYIHIYIAHYEYVYMCHLQ